MLARLRTGECYEMGKFRSRIGLNKVCRWCKSVDETVDHIFFVCENAEVKMLRSKHKISKNNGCFTKHNQRSLIFYKEVLKLIKPARLTST